VQGDYMNGMPNYSAVYRTATSKEIKLSQRETVEEYLARGRKIRHITRDETLEALHRDWLNPIMIGKTRYNKIYKDGDWLGKLQKQMKRLRD